jgi:hypothetical protein
MRRKITDKPDESRNNTIPYERPFRTWITQKFMVCFNPPAYVWEHFGMIAPKASDLES